MLQSLIYFDLVSGWQFDATTFRIQCEHYFGNRPAKILDYVWEQILKSFQPQLCVDVGRLPSILAGCGSYLSS